MNRDSFFKSQNESRIDNSRKFENRAYPNFDISSVSSNQNILCSRAVSKLCRAVKKRGRDGAQDDGQSEGPGERRPHRQEPARRLGLMPTHLYIGVKTHPAHP